MFHLDDLDVRILRELNTPDSPEWKLRVSFTALARRLGVDEETVRLRVVRLRDQGVIPTWRLAINPRLLGCEESGIDLEVDDESAKGEVLARLHELPGVTQVADFWGPGILAIVWHDGPDAPRWLKQALRPPPAWTIRASWTSPFPEPTITMRTIDWRILSSMRDDARKDLRTVASALGTTVRTVHRRLSAITEGKAAFAVGTPNVDRTAGLLCNYLVQCTDVGRKRAADRAVHESIPRIGTYDTGPDRLSMFGVACENLAQAEEVLTRLRSLYQVDSVRMGVIRKIVAVDAWLDRRLKDLGQPGAGATQR